MPRHLIATALLTLGLLASACDTAPDIELIPMDVHISSDFVDFGQVPTGGSKVTTIRLHNAGDADLRLSQVPYIRQEGVNQTFTLEGTWEVTEAEDEESEPTVTIDPRTYVEMTITFTPVAEEESYAYVGIYSNDPDEANRVIVLTGSSYTGTPQVQVSPGLVEFGFVAAGNQAEEYVEIANIGDVDVEVVDVTVGGSESPFEVGAIPTEPIPAGSKALVPVLFNSEGGDHEVASLTVEIANAVNAYYVVNLSANSPGSTNNSPPIINLLDPTEPTVFYLYQDLYVLARAFDAQQPNIGLYCTMESDRLGMVEQETSDPLLSEVDFIIDIDESNFEDELGTHTLTICCTDVFNETSCETLVVAIDLPFPEEDGDGDGYDVDSGDCDDTDNTIYPGAIELTDMVDNNCNGTIDEATENYDDDGDGFSESLGDCNDEDPEVYRDALEWCDSKDNDCDGEADEDCIDDTPPLEILGGLLADRVAVQKSDPDPVNLAVTVIHGPDAELEYEWSCSGGEYEEFDGTAGPTARWIVPEEPDEYSVYVRVTDSVSVADETLEDWAFLTITVTQTNPNATGVSVNQQNDSCNIAASAAPAPGLLATVSVLLLALALRRRT